MKVVEKKSSNTLLLLTQKEIQLITSALGEVSNVLDVDDCETRTGYNLEEFEDLFYKFNLIDDR